METSRKSRRHSEDTKRKISLSKKGCTPWNKGKSHLKGIPKPWKTKRGEESETWKGDKVGYRGLHVWVQIQMGKPEYCVKCGKHGTGHKMHWANISGKYKRDITDWVILCPKCNKEFDKNNRNRK